MSNDAVQKHFLFLKSMSHTFIENFGQISFGYLRKRKTIKMCDAASGKVPLLLGVNDTIKINRTLSSNATHAFVLAIARCG